MIARFINTSSVTFNFNGTPQFKVFLPLKVGSNSIKVISAFDSRLVLMPATNIADIEIDNQTYNDVDDAINMLKDVVFAINGASNNNDCCDANALAIQQLEQTIQDLNFDDQYYTEDEIDQMLSGVVVPSQIPVSSEINGNFLNFLNNQGNQLFSQNIKPFLSQGTHISINSEGKLVLLNDYGEILDTTNLNNNVKITNKYIYINWNASGSRDEKVIAKINSLPNFNISGNEILKFYTYKNQTQYQVNNYNPEKHWWEFRLGEGNYGFGGTQLQGTTSINYLGYTLDNYENVNHNLGEIGTVLISAYINANNEVYQINTDRTVIFQTTRNGVAFIYHFIGNQTLIGNLSNSPESQEVYESDFSEVSQTPPAPQDLSSFATRQNLDATLPYEAKYYLTDIITNADPANAGNEEFVLFETDNAYYFGQKTTNEVDFLNCRLILRVGGFKYDLEDSPDLTQGGYNYWQIALSGSVNLTPGNGIVAFGKDRKFVEGGTPELTEQLIGSGGNYNDLVLEGNVLVFTNTNAQAIINGLDSSEFKDLIFRNKGDFSIRINSESAIGLANGKFNLLTDYFNIQPGGTARAIFSVIENRWKLISDLATKYRPEHRGITSTKVIVVNQDSEEETRDIYEPIVFRDAQSTPMTEADLNSNYPDVTRPFEVICNHPNVMKCYYLLKNSPKEWGSTQLTIVN